MSELFPVPLELRQVEYVQLILQLELNDYCHLSPLGLLQLRRELRQALRRLQSRGDDLLVLQARALLLPEEGADPLLRKLFKRPPPGMVLAPDPCLKGVLEPRQRISLPVLLLGSALREFEGLIALFEELGRQGLYNGSGRFRLAAIETEGVNGQRELLWTSGAKLSGLQLKRNDLYWWLQHQPLSGSNLELELLSPMRLLRRGKPVFRADFADFFPFLLRRVTAMLACYGGIEPVADPGGLIALARQVEVCAGRWQWQDWRRLAGETQQQDLGGLLGSLKIRGPALAELIWLLHLGRLFNVGKGAPYGAGQYRLRTD